MLFHLKSGMSSLLSRFRFIRFNAVRCGAPYNVKLFSIWISWILWLNQLAFLRVGISQNSEHRNSNPNPGNKSIVITWISFNGIEIFFQTSVVDNSMTVNRHASAILRTLCTQLLATYLRQAVSQAVKLNALYILTFYLTYM